MSRLLIQLVVLAVLVAALYGIAFLPSTGYPEARTIGQRVSSFKELSDRFATLAREKGAVYAFEVLGRAELPPNTDLHLLGHVVGDELYKEKGVAGIADCTQDFRNACSHTIVIGALTEFGEKALPMIRDACTYAPGGSGAYTMCFHGLGHGVFAFFDYDLGKTVSFCRKTGTDAYRDREYIECVGGAVMELMGGGGHDHENWLLARGRYLTENPLSPCMDSVVPREAKTICLTYLTPRLFELAEADLGNPDPAYFPEAFSFCDAIPKKPARPDGRSGGDQDLRDACFGGFGKEFIVLTGARDIRRVDEFTDEEFAKAGSWCELAGTEEGQKACLGDALSSVFWGGENDPDAAFRFCDLVSEDSSKRACFERLAKDISTYVQEDNVRAALCARLPYDLRASCTPSV